MPPHDLRVLPDLSPPPDLVLPFICRQIYVVDGDNQMLSGFDTQTEMFYDVAPLKCPGVLGGATPITMSISRDGSAWVFYTRRDDGVSRRPEERDGEHGNEDPAAHRRRRGFVLRAARS